ncbi:hypothetical protein BGZ65_005368, partial [Modicella reniformis]
KRKRVNRCSETSGRNTSHSHLTPSTITENVRSTDDYSDDDNNGSELPMSARSAVNWSRGSTPSSSSTSASSSKEKMYKCLYPGCEKAYAKPSRLTEHERVHTEEVTRKDHLAVHISGHGSTRDFKCIQSGCTRAFYTKDKLVRHLKSHDGIIPSPSSHSSAMSDDYRTPGMLDDEKGRLSLDPETIQRIADVVAKEKVFACTWDGCYKRFKKHKKLKAHICMDHEGRKPYPCTHEGCVMSFQTPSKLRNHQLGHSDALRYRCGAPGCDIGFTKWSLLQKHNKTCHKTIPCSTCGKMTLKRNMNAHIKIHDTSRPVLACKREGCTKVFSTDWTLGTHIKTIHEKSTEEPKFKCEYEGCGKGFAFKHVLERHVARIHVNPVPRKKREDAIESGIIDDLVGFTEEAAMVKLPYACTISGCERRYRSENMLRRHLNSRAHRTGNMTGLDVIQSMNEFENQAIRDMIIMNLENCGND